MSGQLYPELEQIHSVFTCSSILIMSGQPYPELEQIHYMLHAPLFKIQHRNVAMYMEPQIVCPTLSVTNSKLQSKVIFCQGKHIF